MNKANKIKLGAFILFATTLILGSFLAIGILQLFEPKFKAMTVLKSSVQGLSVGSQIKYMGVPIGRVTRIAMRSNDGYIDVYFDIFASAMDTVEAGMPTNAAGNQQFDALMRNKKLSCFLNASGIMGGNYLELTFEDKAKYSLPDLEVVPPYGVFYIKSRSSHVANVIQNISQTLDQLTKIDIVELVKRINQTLTNADDLFDSKQLEEMLPRFNQISKDAEAAIKELRRLLAGDKIKNMGDELFSFIKEARKFVVVTGKSRDVLLDDVERIKNKLIESTVRFNRMLQSLLQLINSFEDDPNQIIRGRQAKPLFKVAPPEIGK